MSLVKEITALIPLYPQFGIISLIVMYLTGEIILQMQITARLLSTLKNPPKISW